MWKRKECFLIYRVGLFPQRQALRRAEVYDLQVSGSVHHLFAIKILVSEKHQLNLFKERIHTRFSGLIFLYTISWSCMWLRATSTFAA